MKIDFKTSFNNDLKKVKDKSLKLRVYKSIKDVENAENTLNIKNIKMIEGKKGYFRIRIGDYRIGLKIENDLVIFARFKHRKDIYKFFP